MAALFDDGGLRFRYPESWQIEREDTEAGWTVSVQSPGTAFLMISLREDLPTTDQLADETLAALQTEYPGLEAEAYQDTVAGQPAIGHEIRFFSFDLTNTCWTRAIYTGLGTLLILCQTNDLELETAEPVFRAICASLRVDEE